MLIMAEQKNMAGLVTGLVALLATACFFILGFTTGGWHIVWVIFLAVPVTSLIMDFVSKRENKLDSLVGLVAVLAAGAYFILGFAFHLWHPGWMVFLAIPVAGIIADIVTKRKDISGSIVGIVAMVAVVVFFLLGFLLHIWYIAWVVFLIIPITAIILNMVKISGKNKNDSADQ